MPSLFSLLSLPGLAAAGLVLIPVVASDFDARDTTDPLDPMVYATTSVDRLEPPSTENAFPSPTQPQTSKATPLPSTDQQTLHALPNPPKAKRNDTPQVIRVVTGEASWYGPGFYGNRTASGEVYRPGTMTAAHRSLPFGTQVRVTNLWNGRSAVIRINDRGPFVDHRIIDLGHGAANSLGLTSSGIAKVRMEILR